MRRFCTLLLAVFFAAALLFSANIQASTDREQEKTKVGWRDYNGKRIGVLTGPLMEDAAKEYFPDSEYFIFNTYPDCITALLSGKIDAYLGDEPGLKSVHAEQPEIDYIHDRITENNYSFAFRKDDPESVALCEELDEFLTRCWSDGTMQELDEIWFGVDEARKVVDMEDLSGENGTIKVVTTTTDMPFSYIKDGKNVGYDIDLVVRFCRDRGYALELGDVDFAGRIPAIQSGKYDFTTDMNVTPEREEQVLFSKPTSQGGIVLAVLSSDLAGGATTDTESQAAGETGGDGVYTSLEKLAGKRIGVQTGTISGEAAQSVLPDIQLNYYNTQADAMAALRSGKVDAWASEEAVIRFVMIENTDLTMIKDKFDSTSLAAVFPKTEEGQALCDAYSAFVEELWADGTMAEIDSVWFGSDEEKKVLPDYDKFPDTNGTLRMAADTTLPPFSYVKDQRSVGYDLDVASRFCEAHGYRLEVIPMSFDGVLASVQSGKVDFASDGITVTEERKESILFSSPVYYSGTAAAVLKRDAEKVSQETVSDAQAALSGSDSAAALDTGEAASNSIWKSFEKTFLREKRYLLFLEGIGTTMLITILSVLFGTALGFLVFMLCRNGNVVANSISRFAIWLVQGMPMVVLLMILYYIVFASAPITGVAVAVIGFTLTFGAAVFGMLKMGVNAVDKGQYEAAYALGHTNRHTFFRIILPQALPHVMPAYQGEIVGLIKATAIVGYIAVQDLTKMGDIVRSRTYEAFFPLIAVTVIYFVLEGILSFVVSRISIKTDPKKRKRDDILKGVDIHD